MYTRGLKCQKYRRGYAIVQYDLQCMVARIQHMKPLVIEPELLPSSLFYL